jgi:1-acyl-sn-glycerol-3-phosphate acyltransferase
VAQASSDDGARRGAPPRAPGPVAPLYRLGHLFFTVVVRLRFGLHVEGRDLVPVRGPCIIASNHFSGWDPPVVGIATPRQLHFMAKRELFARPFFAAVMRGVRAFPVDRARNDIGAVKEALRRLGAGYAVGIFFEGTRNRDAKAVMGGAAYLAQRSGASVVPTAIWREGRAFRVRFDAPIVPQGMSREAAAELTAELAERVRAMLPKHEEATLQRQDDRP